MRSATMMSDVWAARIEEYLSTDETMRVTRRELRRLLDGLSLEQSQTHKEVTARTVI